jgi:GNAT superfamily N-acetyltransferase
MGESFQVRAAQLDDAVALAALNHEFNDVAMPPGQIAACLRSDRHSELVVVAEVTDHVIGAACVQIMMSMCYPQPWAELTELYVRESHRGQGIGGALVHETERLARVGTNRHAEPHAAGAGGFRSNSGVSLDPATPGSIRTLELTEDYLPFAGIILAAQIW